jgi:8-amino-7-oxononanoate synthase
MDGDLTPLAEIVQLSKKHNASIVVDEAHATGIFGAGLVQRDHLHHDVLATIHTGGKALGVSGAWIAGADSLKDYLIQFSRSQIFSTALSPWIAAALGSAVEYWYKVGPDRAERVLENMRTISNQLNGSSPIFPFVCGSSEHALHTATRMQQLGLDVRAVRFPTVPEDQARLRITCPWGRSKDEIKRLKTALNEVWHG